MEKQTKKGRWLKISLTIIGICVILAGLCHIYLYCPVPKKMVSVEYINRVEVPALTGQPANEISFRVVNNAGRSIQKIKGVVTIVRKSDEKKLYQNEVVLSDFSNDSLSPGEQEEFYLYLYDSSVDHGGIENFYEIYSTNESDLEVSFKIKSNVRNEDHEFESSSDLMIYYLSRIATMIVIMPIIAILSFILGLIMRMMGIGPRPKKGKTLNDEIENVGKK